MEIRWSLTVSVLPSVLRHGNWLADTLTGSGGDGIPGGLRREVWPGPQDRDGAGPGPEGDPLEILRGLQVRQAEGVITAPMPLVRQFFASLPEKHRAAAEV
jgi:hypothetical protein